MNRFFIGDKFVILFTWNLWSTFNQNEPQYFSFSFPLQYHLTSIVPNKTTALDSCWTAPQHIAYPFENWHTTVVANRPGQYNLRDVSHVASSEWRQDFHKQLPNEGAWFPYHPKNKTKKSQTVIFVWEVLKVDHWIIFIHKKNFYSSVQI